MSYLVQNTPEVELIWRIIHEGLDVHYQPRVGHAVYIAAFTVHLT